MFMDACDIAVYVNIALSEAQTHSSIRVGFEQMGLVVQDACFASLKPLHEVMLGGDDPGANKERLEELFEKYCRQSRSLAP